MANTMSLLGLLKNVIHAKVYTYNRWHHCLCKEGYLVTRCEAPIGDIAGPHAYQMLMMQTKYMGPPRLPSIHPDCGLGMWMTPFSFLDTLLSPGPDNTSLTTVYRKPTHTNQYQHWDSHHNVSAKYSVF